MGNQADINPLHSSLFQGGGLPWSPMSSAEPGDMPNTPTAVDPTTMKAYDQSAMVRKLIGNLQAQGSKEQLGAIRSASRMGAGQSDAARQQINDINAETENRAAGVQLQAAKDAWDSQLQQAQFQDQMNMARYNAALQQWQAKKGMYDAEKAARGAGLKGMMTLGGSSIMNDIGGNLPGNK